MAQPTIKGLWINGWDCDMFRTLHPLTGNNKNVLAQDSSCRVKMWTLWKTFNQSGFSLIPNLSFILLTFCICAITNERNPRQKIVLILHAFGATPFFMLNFKMNWFCLIEMILISYLNCIVDIHEWADPIKRYSRMLILNKQLAYLLQAFWV